MKKIIPGLAWYRPLEPFGYAFIRVCSGIVFAVHGIDRLFHHPSVREFGSAANHLPAGLIGGFELAGGAMLAIGLFSRPLALLFALEWLIIAAAVPVPPGTSWFMLSASWHYPSMMAAICVAFVMRGGGYYSLDRTIGKEI
jgi:putative oxidoreductase